jgi:hypothetical protein
MSTREVYHSYGPTCAFYDDSRDSEDTSPSTSDAAPKIRVQFFYVSSLPIDDPLSPLPALSSSQTYAKVPPQPFSARDNAALEEAWLGLQHTYDKKQGEKKKGKEQGGEDQRQGRPEKRGRFEGYRPEDDADPDWEQSSLGKLKTRQQRDGSEQSRTPSQIGSFNAKQDARANTQSAGSQPQLMLCDYPEHHLRPESDGPVNEQELAEAHKVHADVSKRKERSPQRLFRKKSEAKSELKAKVNSKTAMERDGTTGEQEVSVGHAEAGGNDGEPKPKRSKTRLRSPFRRKEKHEDQVDSSPERPPALHAGDSLVRPGDTSGNPFARAPSRSPKGAGLEINVDGTNDIAQEVAAKGAEMERKVETAEYKSNETPEKNSIFRPRFKQLKSERSPARSDSESSNRGRPSWFSKSKDKEAKKAYVPVGVSRLHLVEMPSLQV